MRKLLNPDGPHMSESVVSRFLPFLEQWYFSYPTPLTLTSSVYAPSTLASRLGTAANAYLHHQYPAKFTTQAFKTIWDDTKMACIKEGVVLSPRNTITATTTASPYMVTKEDPTAEEVTALAFLYARNFFPAPSCLKGKNVLDPTSSFPNVGFVQVAPDTYILS